MLVIRLSRTGRRNLAHYRLVVQQKHVAPTSGRTVAIVGSYNPSQPENKVMMDLEKVQYYLGHGAQPSNTVARLMKKAGVAGVEKYIRRYTHKVNPEKLKAQQEAQAQAAQDAAK